MARRCCAVPLAMDGTKLVVVMAEPQNLQLLDELRFKCGMIIEPRLGFRAELESAIERFYGPTEPVVIASQDSSQAPRRTAHAPNEGEMEFISFSSQERNVEAMREMQSELLQKSKTTPAVMVVASMIKAAAERRASDIHIEPQSDGTAVRFRVDGMLREYQRLQKILQNSVASRIKILSEMDIAERRAPQDGRFLVKIGGRRIDLRVSTLPTQHGEKVVMRLLEGEAPLQELSKLGFPRWMKSVPADAPPAAGHDSRHRSHRLRQKHHALFRAQFDSPSLHQHHHRRGPRRIRRRRPQSSAGEHQSRPHLRNLSPLHSPARPGRHHGRRNP